MLGRGLALFIISRVIVYILYPIGFIFSIVCTLFKQGIKATDNYLFNAALADDKHGNAYLAKLFNVTLLKRSAKEVFRFGDSDTTISFVLAVNRRLKSLSTLGHYLWLILEIIDKNHGEKSILNEYRANRKTNKYIKELYARTEAI